LPREEQPESTCNQARNEIISENPLPGSSKRPSKVVLIEMKKILYAGKNDLRRNGRDKKARYLRQDDQTLLTD
jgi:hypothetical protein